MKYKLGAAHPLVFPLCMLALIGISTLIAGNFRWMKETWGATYVHPATVVELTLTGDAFTVSPCQT